MDFAALGPTGVYTQYAPMTALGTPESRQQLTCHGSNDSHSGIQQTKATNLPQTLALTLSCPLLCRVSGDSRKKTARMLAARKKKIS